MTGRPAVTPERHVRSATLKVCGAAVLLVVSGCGDSFGHARGPMMGGDSGYHFSAARCAGPSSVPGQRVSVSLSDMGMTRMMDGVAPLGAHMRLAAVPTTVRAGSVTFVGSNVGWRTHELLVLPLSAGSSAGQRRADADGKVSEEAKVGEASRSCAQGTGDGIAAGAVGWTTIALSAGRYELVCNVRNHYANGMHQELLVVRASIP